MDIISIILTISVIVNLVLGFGIRNLLRQNEALEDTLVNTINDTKEYVTNALNTMKDSDLRGAFESDDEVGSAFKDITDAIENLNEKF